MEFIDGYRSAVDYCSRDRAFAAALVLNTEAGSLVVLQRFGVRHDSKFIPVGAAACLSKPGQQRRREVTRGVSHATRLQHVPQVVCKAGADGLQQLLQQRVAAVVCVQSQRLPAQLCNCKVRKLAADSSLRWQAASCR